MSTISSRLDSDTVQQAFRAVVDCIEQTVPDDEDVPSFVDEKDAAASTKPTDEIDDRMEHESLATIKQQSPFTQHFASSLDELSDDDDDDNSAPNNLYNPTVFKLITDVMHLYPLWAAALHGNVDRFAADYTATTSDTKMPHCCSNAVVESHFKSVKHGLKNRRRVRPRDFVLERLRSAVASVNKAGIQFPETRKGRRAAASDDPSSAPEVWNRTPKRRRYRDKNVSLRILGDTQTAASKKSKKACDADYLNYLCLFFNQTTICLGRGKERRTNIII